MRKCTLCMHQQHAAKLLLARPTHRPPSSVLCCPHDRYIYAPLPPATSYGHRAELWNPDKWLCVSVFSPYSTAALPRSSPNCCAPTTLHCTLLLPPQHNTLQTGGEAESPHSWRQLLCAHAHQGHRCGSVCGCESVQSNRQLSRGGAGHTEWCSLSVVLTLCAGCVVVFRLAGELFAECPLPADGTPLTTVRG